MVAEEFGPDARVGDLLKLKQAGVLEFTSLRETNIPSKPNATTDLNKFQGVLSKKEPPSEPSKALSKINSSLDFMLEEGKKKIRSYISSKFNKKRIFL